MAVSPERFRRQLAALQDAGYQGLSLSQVIASLKGPGFRPGYALTFDDGYASVLDSGLRILSEAAVPATLFVTIDFIDGKIAPPWRSSNRELLREYELNAGHFRPLDWGQLREIVASGLVEIGSHSMSHPLLATLAPEQAEAELSRSKAILEDRLGVRVRYFSYPFGVRRYGAYSDATEAMVRRVGYEASCTAEPGRVALGDDPFLMPRIPLVDQDGDIDTCAKAAGAYDWVGVAQAAFHHVFPNPHV
jgi:peptidoglycan/xylan/chitin deacetylase (PgdA/CDA1 family)